MFGKKKDKKKPVETKSNDFIENSSNNKRLVGEDAGNVSIKELFKDKKTHQVIGLFFILFSAYLFFSFISYWWNYVGAKTDQALVSGSTWQWFSLQQQLVTHNFMGYLGAVLSDFLIFRLFGVLAVWPVFLLFNYGFKLFLGKYLYSIKKPITLSVFLLIWGSLAFGFFSIKSSYFLGGGIGFFSSLWLDGLIGWVGTLLLIIFSLVIFGVYFLKMNILPRILSEEEIKNEVHEDFETDDEHPEEEIQIKEDSAIPISFETHQPLGEEEAEEEDVQLINLDPISETPISKKEVSSEDEIPFEIEEQVAVEEHSELIDNPPTREHIGIDEPYDPWLDLPGYQFPTDDLLKDYDINKAEVNREELENSKNLIVETLKNYNIGIAEIKATIGPTVTLYEIIPVSGVRISKIKNLEDDIALSLAALGIRIIAPIPGKGTIGIEVPNKKPEMVPMSTVIKSKKFKDCNFELPVILGKTISNELYIADLAKMPHLLVAGATGQGKSVGLNCLIVSLLYKKHPTELKLVLVDPKKVELSIYSKLLKHFLAKLPGDGDAIITDTNVVKDTLNSLCIEMDNRYDLLKEAGCRNLIEYNNKFKQRRLNPEKGHQYLPYIVAIIDEVADLMMTAGREVETPIARLAQLARAVGIHVILATQRPSVNIITGTIKANFPARLAFRVTSKIDSRTILDNNGADQLIGKGDMLFYSGSELIRLQCPFVDTPEAEAVVDFIGDQRSLGGPFILPEAPGEEGEGSGSFDGSDKDELFEEAARIVVETQQGSTSMIQRKLKIGYNRAGRLIDQLEMAGVVGPGKGSKARDVMFHDLQSLEHFLDTMNSNL